MRKIALLCSLLSFVLIYQACSKGGTGSSTNDGQTKTETGGTPTPTPTASPTPTATPVAGWSKWSHSDSVHFRGEVYFNGRSQASDPTIVKKGSVYHLYYTCMAAEAASANNVSAAICHATSSDGVNWTLDTGIDSFFKAVVFRGINNTWEEEIETAHVSYDGSQFVMIYSGYKRLVSGNRPPAQLGRATSADGSTWTRSAGNPFLTPTPQGYDADDLFSPILFTAGGLTRLIYVGWCVAGYHDGANCTNGDATQIVGATRNASGTWVKETGVSLAPKTNPSWMAHGVAEPDILVGPDGYYYLFFSGALGSTEPRVTGIGRSTSPFGPWDLNPEPIVKPSGKKGAFDACGAFAPAVRLEGSYVRMWYLGLDDCAGTCSSCDHKACGCDPTFSLGYSESTWPLYTPK